MLIAVQRMDGELIAEVSGQGGCAYVGPEGNLWVELPWYASDYLVKGDDHRISVETAGHVVRYVGTMAEECGSKLPNMTLVLFKDASRVLTS